jgi:hypothetical protein
MIYLHIYLHIWYISWYVSEERPKDSWPIQCQDKHKSQWGSRAFCGMQGSSFSSHVMYWTQLFFTCFFTCTNSVMQHNGVPMFFDSASSTNLPSLYICRAENVLGRVPLMPFYIGSNTHPTLPHSFSSLAGATADSSLGSPGERQLKQALWAQPLDVELWAWMWSYGWGQPHKVTVVEAVQKRRECLT